jgi:hypothetical protein
MKRKSFLIVFVLLLLLAPAYSVNAQAVTCEEGKICNPIPRVTSLNSLIKTVLEGALKIGMPFIALAIIYSGFLFVAARGNPESLSKAKTTLMYTLIGAAILLGSWAIAKLISETVLSLR